MFLEQLNGRRVLITGHTGFKGSWLCSWCLHANAEIIGVGLDPDDNHPLYTQLGLSRKLKADYRADIRNSKLMAEIVAKEKPEFVFHLAAQPLVRVSYADPATTFSTNVQGLVNLLDALRVADEPCIVVVVTSDKCYENREWTHAYRECDQLGGHDPYSASKACAEIAVASFQQSYFGNGSNVHLASGRAGNVIGGGDRALDRIVPDCLKAFEKGDVVLLRNPNAYRPWQHVLEPLSGYLQLATAISEARDRNDETTLKHLCSAFNFGPHLDSQRTVVQLVAEFAKHLGGAWRVLDGSSGPHEASLLNLSIDKAWHILGWRPVWNFATAVARVVEFHLQTTAGINHASIIADQIKCFERDASSFLRSRKHD